MGFARSRYGEKSHDEVSNEFHPDRAGRAGCDIAMVAVSFLPVEAASAHCDGLDGPVVKAAPTGLADRRSQPGSHLGPAAK